MMIDFDNIESLKKDWDDDGAAPISKQTIGYAKCIESRINEWGLPWYSKPVVGPCSDGSIDLHWRFKSFQVLINVKPNGTGDYYATNYSSTSSGKFANIDECYSRVMGYFTV